MSVQATTWVWEHSRAEGNARLVLLAIADAANREGERSFQSAETIAQMCRISARSVRRHVAVLQDLGELEVEGRQGPHGTNSYRLPMTHPIGHSRDLGQSVRGDNPGQPLGQSGSPVRTIRVASSDTAVSTNPITPEDPISTPGGAADADAPSTAIAETEEPHPAHLIAQRAYDATHGALKFIAVRQVAQWAIDKRGADPDRVEHAIADIHHRGKPVTRAVVDQWLDGAFDRKPHWQMSSDDRAAAALEQMRGAMTPTEDLMDRALEEGR